MWDKEYSRVNDHVYIIEGNLSRQTESIIYIPDKKGWVTVELAGNCMKLLLFYLVDNKSGPFSVGTTTYLTVSWSEVAYCGSN
jgi:hypothetical protein